MQMENIFNEIEIQTYYFDPISIKTDFHCYVYYNLEDENYETFRWDLRNALINNANGEYI
jgi:hypothetical protein